MTAHTFKNANGTLTLDLGWRGGFQKFTIAGGPFDRFEKTPDTVGVCVREERVPANADVVLPIRDFKVPGPHQKSAVVGAIKFAAMAAMDGKSVYVGCMGGWGRTGLFLAIMAKAAGVADPVAYVQAKYTSHAVETPQQKAYVEQFDTAAITKWLNRQGWKRRFSRFF